MIKKIDSYSVVCDHCGESLMTTHEGWSMFADEQHAQESADNEGWYCEEDNGDGGPDHYYCKECHWIDDNDEMHLRMERRKELAESSPSPSPDREVGGLRWVRASDIEYEMVTRVVFAKRADDFTCKGIGRFQQSDGTFFWQVQGIIPIPLKDHDKLLILCEDESPSLPADKPESPESFKKWLDYNCDPHNATAVDSAPFVEWLDKEIEGTGFPDVFTRKLIAVKQKYLSLRQPQALPIEEGGEMPSELNEWMSEEEDKIDNIEHMFGYRLGAIAMWKRIGFEREEALTLAGKMGEGWRRETQELFSLRTQLQSLTEERDAIKTAYAEQREELEKARYSMRECYYDGFNQAHYSHLHPDVCPPKEMEQAATEYFNKKEAQ